MGLLNADFALMVHVALLLMVFFVLAAISFHDVRLRIIAPKYLAALFLLWIATVPVVAVQSGISETLAYILQRGVCSLLVFALLLLFSVLYERACGRQSIGGGDIKLLAVLALFLKVEGAFLCLFFACVIMVAVMAARKTLAPENTFPFAPAICASASVLLAVA